MKLKHEFVFQKIGKSYVSVAVGKSANDFHGVIKLNEVGYDIVTLMKEETTEEQMVEKLLEMYDADRETITQYVRDVVEYLKEQEVI